MHIMVESSKSKVVVFTFNLFTALIFAPDTTILLDSGGSYPLRKPHANNTLGNCSGYHKVLYLFMC